MKKNLLISILSLANSMTSDLEIFANNEIIFRFSLMFEDSSPSISYSTNAPICVLANSKYSDCQIGSVILTNDLTVLPIINSFFSAVIVPSELPLPTKLVLPLFKTDDYQDILYFMELSDTTSFSCKITCYYLNR